VSICIRTGLPHVAEDCDACIELEAHLAYARVHPNVVAARERSDEASRAYEAGKLKLPVREWYELEKAWRAAIDASQAAFVDACNEYKTAHQGDPTRA